MKADEKIEKIRKLMAENKIDIYIIPSSDYHQSEDVGEYFRCREFVSGFTGSAGTLLITKEKSYLWTDGRYFIQAEKEISDTEIELCRAGTEGVPTITEFLKNNLKKDEVLGFDGKTVACREMLNYKKICDEKNAKLNTEYDFVGEIWDKRPSLSKEKIFLLDIKYSGENTHNKLKRVRKAMKEEGADIHIISSLDDIAWLFNIRGRDIPCNPVVLSYAAVTEKEAFIFIDREKITEAVEEYFKENNIEIKEYSEFYDFLKNIERGKKVLLDYERINSSVYMSIPFYSEKINRTNPTQELKAVKNETEIKNIINAHIKDGTAFTKFMYWLKNNIGKEEITEISASNMIEKFRREQEGFIELSFDTISAYGSNAAMMHYTAGENSNAVLKPEGLLLVDSGGQYFQGTTDITRTIALGNINEEIKTHYTAVLRSLIALSDTKFLYGTKGYNLDAIARRPIWEIGLDYRCATGHGVGYLLNVHEGPNIFRMSAPFVMEENMITTIEPGIYIEGSHGIRIENEVLSKNWIKNEYGQFMEFIPVTFAPIDLDAVDVSMLSKREKEWLNNYHKLVFEKISPFLNQKEKEWLKIYTREI
ncbi:aminopeptidase P family protein [Fusobacterium perfoetens]|uniref:aminopeptidase P family protein n=1 Tax=Fusobacterium perfoetens TaxID=852 RepID=UPI001F380AB6|nr:aminopeptidase P family protein [Fusobacterium perfoetens]MCF2624884.1 aminopeptidase P family protein [Fusobacterium perfoetens]